jgi:hypothetical protein
VLQIVSVVGEQLLYKTVCRVTSRRFRVTYNFIFRRKSLENVDKYGINCEEI